MSTARDKTVLNLILNPSLPNASYEAEFEQKSEVEKDPSFLNLPNYDACQSLEIEGVKLAENGGDENFDVALKKFNKAIELCPLNPSPYNNRAQLYRLLGKVQEALSDLDEAIRLSEGKGRSAVQAYVQKGLIYRLQSEDTLARESFEKASELGSSFAKQQLVAMNPYAAMCNQMLSEMMTKFQRGESQTE